MSREEIRERVVEIFHDLLDDDSIEITEDYSRDEHEEWESLFHMTLMATVADEFDIQIDTEDIVGTKDVKSLIDLVEKYL